MSFISPESAKLHTWSRQIIFLQNLKVGSLLVNNIMKLLIVLKQIVSLVLVLKFTFSFFTIFRLEFSLPSVEILKIQILKFKTFCTFSDI